MPIYEYRCKECEHEVEALQKLSDPPLVTCPACGKPALQKLVSAAGFQLKGSGWYVTDFRGGSGGSKKSEKSEKTETSTTDATKSETKSESTTKSDSSAPAAPSTSTTPSSSSES